MEYIEVNPDTFDNINSINDLETIDHVSKKAKRKAAKLTKKASKAKGRKKKRLLRRAKRVETKGTLGERIAKGIKTVVASSTILLPVLPLMPMMKRTLKKKGVSVGKNPLDIVNAFYKNVVKKSKDGGNYEDIDLLDVDEDNLAPAIAAVVSGVIAFIKGIKKKKQSGEKLTVVENVIASGTEEAETQLKAKAQEETAQVVGQKLLFDRKTQFIVIGVVVVVIIIAVIISRKRS